MGGAHARRSTALAPPEMIVLLFCKEFHLAPWEVWEEVSAGDISFWEHLNSLYNQSFNAEREMMER